MCIRDRFINCFHDYHSALSPAEYLWSAEKFQHYGSETLYEDLFVNGYADMAICQPTYLKEFYNTGFNTTEQNAELLEKYSDRIILNVAFDPRDGLRKPLGLGVRNNQPGAVSAQQLSRGASDAAGSARDDPDSSVEATHARQPIAARAADPPRAPR